MTSAELASVLDDRRLPGGGQSYAVLLTPRLAIEERVRRVVLARLAERGWSQWDLSRAMGASQSMVSMMLRGRRHQRMLVFLDRLAKALDYEDAVALLVEAKAAGAAEGPEPASGRVAAVRPSWWQAPLAWARGCVRRRRGCR